MCLCYFVVKLLADGALGLSASMASLSLDGHGKLRVFEFRPKGASKFAASEGFLLHSLCFSGIGMLEYAVPTVVKGLLEGPEMTLEERILAEATVVRALTQQQLSAEKVSETIGPGCVDDVVHVVLADYFCDLDVAKQGTTMEQLYASFGPATRASKPDFAVGCVCVGEFKSTILAPLEQLAQAVAEATNMVLAQLAMGLPWDRCAVLVINTNGHLWQFAAVTLLESSLPHACVLSPVLDALSHGADVGRLLFQTERACSAQCKALAGCVQQPEATGLEVAMLSSKYFLKPTARVLLQSRGSAEGWFVLLDTFRVIWEVKDLRNHVVFPLGFLRNSKGETEGLLFHRLLPNWRIGLPEDATEHRLYCVEFARIVHLLNCKACLVHLDLLPCNVAWCCEGEGEAKRIHLYVVDFDTATPVGRVVAEKLREQRVSRRASCSWPGESDLRHADARSDAWFVYQFPRLVNASWRLSRPVDDESGPMAVNDAFQSGLSALGSDQEGFEQWYSSWK